MASTASTSRERATSDRPEFAEKLGLLPPYSIEDVKRAYREKVKDAHPDHGGDRTTFDKIQHAYEAGCEYLKFRSDRRKWIAARMEEYLAVLSVIERLDSLGAEVETVTLDWMQRSFGDFAHLTESIVGIRLVDSDRVAELIDTIIPEQAFLPALKRLELAGCPVTDRLALELRGFRQLAELDLSRTLITDRALVLIDWLGKLMNFGVDGTSIGWWARFRLQRTLRHRRRTTPDPILHPVNIR